MKSRIKPYVLGAALALIAVLFLSVLLVYQPSSEKYLLGQKKVWVQFGVYSLTLFGWLVTSLRPRHPSLHFWPFFVCVLTAHTVGILAFIQNVRPLGPIHYILFGPLEGLAIVLLWQRVGPVLRKHIRNSGNLGNRKPGDETGGNRGNRGTGDGTFS